VLGDAALVWDQLFVAGILCFAAAHFFYIKALNLKGTILGSDKFRSIGLGVSLYGAAEFHPVYRHIQMVHRQLDCRNCSA